MRVEIKLIHVHQVNKWNYFPIGGVLTHVIKIDGVLNDQSQHFSTLISFTLKYAPFVKFKHQTFAKGIYYSKLVHRFNPPRFIHKLARFYGFIVCLFAPMN